MAIGMKTSKPIEIRFLGCILAMVAIGVSALMMPVWQILQYRRHFTISLGQTALSAVGSIPLATHN
jgi:hypothetical protein